jgi:hypothetical protein
MSSLSENQISIIEAFIAANDAVDMPDVDQENLQILREEIKTQPPNTSYMVDYDSNRRIMYHMYKSSKDNCVYIMATSMRTMFTSYVDPLIGYCRLQN